VAGRRSGRGSGDADGGGPTDGERPRFADLVDGVEPLPPDPRRAPPEPPRRPGRRRREPAAPGSAGEGPARFERPVPDEPRLAYAPGLDAATFRRLRAGRLEVGREVDLHGLDRRGARRALRQALASARHDGVRCLRVVHGRGLRSAAGAVLREALPGWLAEPPHGAAVLGFAPARPGPQGATCVLLRRGARGSDGA